MPFLAGPTTRAALPSLDAVGRCRIWRSARRCRVRSYIDGPEQMAWWYHSVSTAVQQSVLPGLIYICNAPASWRDAPIASSVLLRFISIPNRVLLDLSGITYLSVDTS
jgi:hypothetical protein